MLMLKKKAMIHTSKVNNCFFFLTDKVILLFYCVFSFLAVAYM